MDENVTRRPDQLSNRPRARAIIQSISANSGTLKSTRPTPFAAKLKGKGRPAKPRDREIVLLPSVAPHPEPQPEPKPPIKHPPDIWGVAGKPPIH